MTANGYKETIVGRIPLDWDVMLLGDDSVASIDRGISWGKADESKIGVPVLAIPNVRNGAIVNNAKVFLGKPIPGWKLLKKGDILLVGSSGAVKNVGRSAMVAENPSRDTTFASFLARIRSGTRAEARYLSFVLRSDLVDFEKLSKRAADGKFNLQLESLRSASIPLPPLPEQKKIAAILSKIQHSVEVQEKIIERTKELRKALMATLFTGGLHGEELKQTEIGLMPKSWEPRKIKELQTKVQSGQTPARLRDEFYGGDVKWVKTLDLTEWIVTDTEDKLTEAGFEDLGAKRRPINTVMVAMYGGAGTVGKCGILGVEAATNQAVCCIEPNELVFSPHYLLHFFIHYRPEWMKYAFSTRKDPNISKGIIENTLIPYPPLQEQNELASILDTIVYKIELHKRKRVVLGEFFASLLHQLVTAEFRVSDLTVE